MFRALAIPILAESNNWRHVIARWPQSIVPREILMASQSGASSLTGVWQGLYSYPGIGEPTPFTATLIQTGTSFGGSTHETALVGRRQRATLCAMVDGLRNGQRVQFTKTYDGSAGWDHSVDYDGAMSVDGTEIEGRWRVRGGVSGRFLMTRPAGKGLAVERRVAERV